MLVMFALQPFKFQKPEVQKFNQNCSHQTLPQFFDRNHQNRPQCMYSNDVGSLKEEVHCAQWDFTVQLIRILVLVNGNLKLCFKTRVCIILSKHKPKILFQKIENSKKKSSLLGRNHKSNNLYLGLVGEHNMAQVFYLHPKISNNFPQMMNIAIVGGS